MGMTGAVKGAAMRGRMGERLAALVCVDRWRPLLRPLAAVAILLDLAMIFGYAPADRLQGDVQRIFYVHVPLAIVAFFAFFVVFVGSVGYLFTRQARWDVWARSSAEVAVVFTTFVLMTGSLWAKPIWGTWWTWDARLTTTLLLWLIGVGYLLVRTYSENDERAARFAAVIGVIAFLDVPIIRQSVVWWRTLHPGPTIVQQSGEIGLPPAMLLTFLVSLLVMGIVYLTFLFEKVHLERQKEAANSERRRLLELLPGEGGALPGEALPGEASLYFGNQVAAEQAWQNVTPSTAPTAALAAPAVPAVRTGTPR